MEEYSAINKILDDTSLFLQIQNTANDYGLNSKDLEVKTLLHLPRFSAEQVLDKVLIRNEIDRLANKLLKLRNSDYKGTKTDYSKYPLDSFKLTLINENLANNIIYRYHYLNSPRESSTHLGLVLEDNNDLVGVISISDFDLFHIDIGNLTPNDVKVVSRIYTVEGLPSNALSRFIGGMFKWVSREIPSVKLLLTYLNKNLKFSGAIYKATNWSELAKEFSVRYNYFNHDYVTDRFLIKKFGTASRKKLIRNNSINLEFSKFDLHPLLVLAYPLIQNAQIIKNQIVYPKRD